VNVQSTPPNGKIDLVLVNPGSKVEIYQSLSTHNLTASEPPVWAGLMATYVRRKGHSVRIIDADAEGLTPGQVVDRVREMNPLLVAVVVYGHQPSASTQNMTAAGRISAAVTAAGFQTLLVGGHIAALPERTLRDEAVDFVGDGEGLVTLVELVEALRSANPDLGKVRGLWWRDGAAVRRNESAPLLHDLDGEMPGIAWDLLPMPLYRAHNWHCLGQPGRQPYAAIYTTLGCPFHCSFCCIQAPFKRGEHAIGLKEGVNSYRFWSVDRVLSEIDLLVNRYGVRNIKIADEMFVLNPRHVEGICKGIVDRGYDLNIWAYSRVDTIKSGMAGMLRDAGITWLAFGIEAASAKVRDDVQKGFDQDDIARAVKDVRNAGTSVIGNYIFGLPEDDYATMQETLDMALDLNCEYANFYCTMAYPGSALYEKAIAEDMPLPASWSGYSQHAVNTHPLPTRHLTSAQVLAFRDQAFDTYYKSPRYLEMVARTFGACAAREITEMASVKLKREPTPRPTPSRFARGSLVTPPETGRG
jgi:radical SAM superfamily enzyme YgiQ (UPF0313 family)